jgi:hypothetical protein
MNRLYNAYDRRLNHKERGVICNETTDKSTIDQIICGLGLAEIEFLVSALPRLMYLVVISLNRAVNQSKVE